MAYKQTAIWVVALRNFRGFLKWLNEGSGTLNLEYFVA